MCISHGVKISKFHMLFPSYSFFFKKYFIYLFLERGEGKERERETSSVVTSHMLPARDLTHDPGMCPDWESNQRLFGLQASTQSIESHQLGLKVDFVRYKYCYSSSLLFHLHEISFPIPLLLVCVYLLI